MRLKTQLRPRIRPLYIWTDILRLVPSISCLLSPYCICSATRYSIVDIPHLPACCSHVFTPLSSLYGVSLAIIRGRRLDNQYKKDITLLQDLTQDSATLTGWRRTKRSGEGKMIALYCPGIYCLRFRP